MTMQIDDDRPIRPASSPSAAFLRSKDAAQYLRDRYGFCSRSTLEKMRLSDSGPAYHRPDGRSVIYSPTDLDAWATDVLTASHIKPRG